MYRVRRTCWHCRHDWPRAIVAAEAEAYEAMLVKFPEEYRETPPEATERRYERALWNPIAMELEMEMKFLKKYLKK